MLRLSGLDSLKNQMTERVQHLFWLSLPTMALEKITRNVSLENRMFRWIDEHLKHETTNPQNRVSVRPGVFFPSRAIACTR